MEKITEILKEKFQVSEKIIELADKTESKLEYSFFSIDKIVEYNQLKVLWAMQKNHLSEIHFAKTTGYGYNDIGRDALENIYADVFGYDAALVRPQIISGTHAISTALFSMLRHGDELLSITGKPYDTLLKVIGVNPANGSLNEHGVIYKEAPLTPEGSVDYSEVKRLITSATKVVAIQRSKGYSWRPSFSVAEINKMVEFVKSIRKDIICFVDNCYGEFTGIDEPIADVLAGSLIKNPGGGIAPVGGYILGSEELIYNAACRLNTPGSGRDVGPSLGFNLPFLQGLFLAPQAVGGALKGAVFCAEIFNSIGFNVLPLPDAERTDIVQAIKMSSVKELTAFCRGIQKAAPVDSFVTPEPWDMPGYDCQVIMAAGAFIQGSSIELSADAPIREPYIVFFQGGLTYAHSKIGVVIGINEMYESR